MKSYRTAYQQHLYSRRQCSYAPGDGVGQPTTEVKQHRYLILALPHQRRLSSTNKQLDSMYHVESLYFGLSLASMGVAKMSRRLTCLIEEHLVDKEIRDWLIPDFTRTTDNNVAVASMTMLAIFNQFFSYAGHTGCGFPSVTLLGQQSDWSNIRARLDLLLSDRYSTELSAWAKLLAPILDRFVLTFTSPENSDLKSSYLSCVHTDPQMSGRTTTFDGSITAFTYFCVNGHRNQTLRPHPNHRSYTLDGSIYPSIEWNSITVGDVEVPVTIEAHEQSTTYETLIIAGSVSMKIIEDGRRWHESRNKEWVVDEGG